MPFPKRLVRSSTNKVVSGLPQEVKKVKAGKSPAKFLRPPKRSTGIAPSRNAVPNILGKIGMLSSGDKPPVF